MVNSVVSAKLMSSIKLKLSVNIAFDSFWGRNSNEEKKVFKRFQQEGLNRITLTPADSVTEDDSSRRHHHHHHHHRRHHSRHTGPQTPKASNADASATEALLVSIF